VLVTLALAGTASAADPVIVAAGDIACGKETVGGACKQKATSDLIGQIAPQAVLPLGDEQYEYGQLSNFVKFYDPTWGRYKSVTRPATGNHEYGTPGAAGYFDYFNGFGVASGAAGSRTTGYYSFDLGSWHLIALNSNCEQIGGCGVGSAQERWLRQDLAANANKCTIAYMHHPRWSSDANDLGDPAYAPFVQALYDYRAELLLVAHAHVYERFAPQTATGAADYASGVRQLIVGTGGKSEWGFTFPQPNSEVRNSTAFGVLKLTLHPWSYDWRFVPVAGSTFSDSGTALCHKGVPDSSSPSAPTGLTATAPSSSRVDLGWTASTDNVGVASYGVFRDGTQVGTTTSTSWSDSSVAAATRYSYTVVARDAAGNASAASSAAVVTTPAAPAPTTLTFSPSADATIDESAPTTALGTLDLVRVDNWPVNHILLRFDLTGLAGRTVVSAKLRLLCTNGSDDGGRIHGLATTPWGDATVTWNTAPVGGAPTIATLGATAVGSWYTVDVTSLVAGDGPVGMRIDSWSGDGATYGSREAGAASAPQLVVTVR